MSFFENTKVDNFKPIINEIQSFRSTPRHLRFSTIHHHLSFFLKKWFPRIFDLFLNTAKRLIFVILFFRETGILLQNPRRSFSEPSRQWLGWELTGPDVLALSGWKSIPCNKSISSFGPQPFFLEKRCSFESSFVKMSLLGVFRAEVLTCLCRPEDITNDEHSKNEMNRKCPKLKM